MKAQLVVEDLDDVVLRKLLKMKDNDQFTSKTWGEWFSFLTRDVFLNDSAGEMIQKSTRQNLLRTWCGNLADNLPSIREMDTIRALAPADEDADKIMGPCVVVGRGPSLFKHQHLKLLGESGFKGVVVASDGALIECLKNGVVPNYAVSVDGNKDLIWKWYDHPLVAENASKIASILCVTVANNVLKHIQKIGVKAYWFNPQFDDWRRNESFTKLQMLLTASEKNPNGAPNVACLGNAGATAWVMSHALLRRSPIALIGMDMGYLPETPVEETSYYRAMMEGTGGNVNLVMQSYGKVHNPFFHCDAVNDAVFRQYRDSFLSALEQINPQIRTVQCSEGGCLFSEDPSCRLEYMKFKDFLSEVSRN